MALTHSGRMNERVTLLKPVEPVINGEWGSGGGGTSSVTYEPVFTCWADVKTQRFKDRITSAGTMYENTLSVVIRRQQKAPYDNAFYLEHKGIRYEVLEITPDYVYKEFVTLTVKEV